MKRVLKVYEMSGVPSRDIPCIRLQGKWLKKLGYKPGQTIILREKEAKLIIEKVSQENKND